MDLKTGVVAVVDGMYDFEWRKDQGLGGNLATVGGDAWSRISGAGSYHTDYLIKYKNSPKIIY